MSSTKPTRKVTKNGSLFPKRSVRFPFILYRSMHVLMSLIPLLVLGGCENFILLGDPTDVSFTMFNLSSPKVTRCQEWQIIGDVITKKYSIRHLHMKESWFYENRSTSCIYNSSKTWFTFDIMNKYEGFYPNINVMLSQNQPYSWLDVIMSVRKDDDSVIENLQRNFIYLKEILSVEHLLTNKLDYAGNIMDDSLQINLLSSPTANITYKIKVEIRNFYPGLYQAYHSYKARSIFSPVEQLSLHWKSILDLSKYRSFYPIKIQGLPKEVNITSMQNSSFKMRITWIRNRNNKFRKYFEQLPVPLRAFYADFSFYCSSLSKKNSDSLGFEATVNNQRRKSFDSSPICELNNTLFNAYKDLFPFSHFLCHKETKNSMLRKNIHPLLSPILKTVQGSCKTQIASFNFGLNYNRYVKSKFNPHEQYYTTISFLFLSDAVRMVLGEINYSYRTQCWKPLKTRKSWIQASILCKSMNATLPIIRSSEELDELVSILKYHKLTAPSVLIPLGLYFDQQVIT